MNRELELLNELIDYRFTCEGGDLEDCHQFRELKELIEARTRPIVGGDLPKLTRPLCFLDLETTGPDPEKDRIVEISAMKFHPDGRTEKSTRLINPGIPIPKEASEIHGITDEMVKDAPTFVQISKGLLDFISGCDLAGFNSNRFDFPMLYSNFVRVGLTWNWKSSNLIDVRNIYIRHEERTLSAGVNFYLNREHIEAHSAEADILETKNIFVQQILRYGLGNMTMKEIAFHSNFDEEIVDMSGKFKKKNGVIVFAFGMHKDKPAASELKYLQWMIDKGEFTIETKAIAQEIILRG